MPRYLFLSTLSLRRATISCAWSASKLGDFYPRSPCGERLTGFSRSLEGRNFYPRSPCGERLDTSKDVIKTSNFYPRSPCGERLNSAYGALDGASISIHALLAESDPAELTTLVNKLFISIHALLAESDLLTLSMVAIPISFLSTLSLRRATTWQRGSRVTYVISIHALLAESDRTQSQSLSA